MKRKILALLMIVMCLFTALYFVGCTDDEPSTNEPSSSNTTNDDNIDSNKRVLTKVEQKLVGEWLYYDKSNKTANLSYTFSSDGQYTTSDGSKGTFKQGNEATDDLFGHYYEIYCGRTYPLRLYDFSDNSLYSAYTPVYTKSGAARVLHSSEMKIVGTWQAAMSSKTQYTFNPNGTFTSSSWSSSEPGEFFLSTTSEHKNKGRYYVFKFSKVGMLDWRIYDNDPNTAIQNTTGGTVATRI